MLALSIPIIVTIGIWTSNPEVTELIEKIIITKIMIGIFLFIVAYILDD